MDAMIPKKRPRDSSASVCAECMEKEPEFVCEKCEKVYCVGHLVYHMDSGPGADPPVSPTSSCGSNKSKIRDEHFEEMLASLVIRLGRPFSYVESKTFVDTLEYLCGGRLPIEVSKENCTSTFDEMYKREKDNLKSVLTSVPGKINFTCDYWVCATSDEFVCLTAHYIDQDWSLKKKTVNFSLIPFPYNPPIVLEHVSDLLKQQGIGQKVFSMIWDDDFPVKACDGVFAGVDYIPIRGAGVLNSIVRDAIKEMEGPIHKARQVLQRVRGIPDTKKFLDCLAYYSLDSARGLRCDVPASWYSTLSMLSGAVYYRSALTRLGTMDEPSEIYPSKEEWDDLEKFYNLVACVHNFTTKLSTAKHLTSSIFSYGMVLIYVTIKRAVNDGCLSMQGIASRTLEKLNVFWKDFSELMALAVVFDPRYKFSYVEFAMNQMYGDDGIAKCMKLKEKLYSLFEEFYAKENVVSPVQSATSSPTKKQGGDLSSDELFEEFVSQRYVRETNPKSELDQYLDEPRLDSRVELDVLSYWKGISFLYSHVAAMARDILSIPISTVVLDAALDFNGKQLDERSCLYQPGVVEAMICTKSWWYGDEDTLKLEEYRPNILKEDSSRSEDSTGNTDSENDEYDLFCPCDVSEYDESDDLFCPCDVSEYDEADM